jgi:hypothetical protein
LTRLSGFSCRNLTRLSVSLESDRVPQPTILQGEREERRGFRGRGRLTLTRWKSLVRIQRRPIRVTANWRASLVSCRYGLEDLCARPMTAGEG